MGCSLPGSSAHGIPQAVLPCPPPGDLPDPGIEPASLVSLALAGGSLTLSRLGSPRMSTSSKIDRGFQIT